MDSMYEILMELPMFRGVSLAKLTEVVEHVKLHFLKLIDGQTIVTAGDPCANLNFIISGSVRSTVATTDERFKVGQTLNAPGVIAPDFLFGRATTFPCTVKAIGTVSLLQISKQDFIDILKSDDIFLFNYINYVSMNAQKAIQGVLAVAAGSLEERIAFWIIALTQPAGTDNADLLSTRPLRAVRSATLIVHCHTRPYEGARHHRLHLGRNQHQIAPRTPERPDKPLGVHHLTATA